MIFRITIFEPLMYTSCKFVQWYKLIITYSVTKLALQC